MYIVATVLPRLHQVNLYGYCDADTKFPLAWTHVMNCCWGPSTVCQSSVQTTAGKEDMSLHAIPNTTGWGSRLHMYVL